MNAETIRLLSECGKLSAEVERLKTLTGKLARQNAAMRTRLEELLEVCDQIDDHTEHQTKATQAALAVE